MIQETLIIAEAGANHDRDKSQAFKLIDEAVKAKVDVVKFQTYSSETLYSKYTPNFAGYKDIPKLLKSLELPKEWQKDLKLYCDDNGVEFMSSPFDEKAVDSLYNLGVKRLKIAGFECTDPRFVKFVASTQLPLIISLGIGTNLDNVTEIYDWVKEVNDKPDITFLHCNNAYPTPYEDINLGQMNKIKKGGFKYGLSDHTEGILTPPIAVALGAEVIEKHYTIDRTLSGPDHPFAIEPDELKEMVKNIRLVETMMGSKNSEYTNSEKDFSMGRRSVIVKGNVTKGDVITESNITTKRPLLNNSVSALEYYNILGKKFSKDLSDDMILEISDVE